MEKNYLQISNVGSMEVEALTLIGASTKRGDNKTIGRFGSGNKYAPVYLLRNNYDLRVFSDTQEIVFDTVPAQFRDMNFEVVTVNGKETSMTTEMGPDWTLWMAIREFYANAVDEGLTKFEFVDEIQPTPGSTDFFIGMTPELKEFFENINDYIAISKETLFTGEKGSILKKHGNKHVGIYRKGMRCYDAYKKSIYDYDFPEISINESRILNATWKAYEIMTDLLFDCDDPVIIRNMLKATIDNDYWEHNIVYQTYNQFKHPDAWLEAIGDKYIAPQELALFIPPEISAAVLLVDKKMYSHMKLNLPGVKLALNTQSVNNVNIIDAKCNPLQQNTLDTVIDFFKEVDFPIDYTIKIVQFSNKEIYGLAKDDTIYLGLNALDKGKHFTAVVMMEEYIHLKHGVADETRAFQQVSLQEFVNYMMLKNAYNL